MSLQKAMDFFGQFRSDAFGRRDLLYVRFPQPLDGTELPQKKIFPVLTHARAIIQNAFSDSFLHQELVISIREAMRFVANPLQQMQRAGIRWQLQGHRSSGPINFFELFRQPNDRQIVQPEPLQFAARGRKLPSSAINDDEIRQPHCDELFLIRDKVFTVIPSGA
jgi:hypothetical protein